LILGKNERLLCIGDSITDCERERPIGTSGPGLGNGYVSLVDAFLSIWEPEKKIEILNAGISGNTILDLAQRWETDVIALKSDWLSIMIGVNDVWRQFSGPLKPGHISIELFEKTYRDILTSVRNQLKGLVLLSPFFLETNRSDPMRQRIDMYSKVVGKMAQEFDAVYIDVQTAFENHLSHWPTQSLCNDRVHPNTTGHMVIAKAFLEGIGLEWI